MAWQKYGEQENAPIVHIDRQSDDTLHATAATKPTKAIRDYTAEAARHFMPVGYPQSVHPSYTPYVVWSMVGSTASACGGVLSMQALLYAIGLGAGSIPAAAALNWVIKDGLGQLGGVAFASMINNRFDADAKVCIRS